MHYNYQHKFREKKNISHWIRMRDEVWSPLYLARRQQRQNLDPLKRSRIKKKVFHKKEIDTKPHDEFVYSDDSQLIHIRKRNVRLCVGSLCKLQSHQSRKPVKLAHSHAPRTSGWRRLGKRTQSSDDSFMEMKLRPTLPKLIEVQETDCEYFNS